MLTHEKHSVYSQRALQVPRPTRWEHQRVWSSALWPQGRRREEVRTVLLVSPFQKPLSPPGPPAEEIPAEFQRASPPTAVPLGNECSKPSKKNLFVLPSCLPHDHYKFCVPAHCAPTLGGSVLPNVERSISKLIVQPIFLTDFAGSS